MTDRMQFSVRRPFRDGWAIVSGIQTFQEAVEEARRGCRYAKRNNIRDDDDLVRIDQEIKVDDQMLHWHGWFMRSEHEALDINHPQTRTTRAWDVHELTSNTVEKE